MRIGKKGMESWDLIGALKNIQSQSTLLFLSPKS